MQHSFVFETSRFRVLGPEDRNQSGFKGNELITWLRTRLAEQGIECGDPVPIEDHCEIEIKTPNDRYFLLLEAVSGRCMLRHNRTEWKITVEKRRSVWEMVAGKEPINWDEEIISVLERILKEETSFRNVRREEG